MTTFPTIRLFSFPWKRRAKASPEPVITEIDDDFRREYMTRLISSEGCGEYGTQALMGLFPKDF